jgi:hypothetical protein
MAPLRLVYVQRLGSLVEACLPGPIAGAGLPGLIFASGGLANSALLVLPTLSKTQCT